MEEKKSYYAIIPANVRYDKNLKLLSRLLYGEITALCNEKGYCWATNKYFSELYNVSIQTISGCINQLKENNYIFIEFQYKENSKEIIKRFLKIKECSIKENLNTYSKNFEYPIKENFKGGIKENLKDNNTSINNTINNNIHDEFINFWNLYPRKVNKANAQKAYKKALKKADSEKIIKGLKTYINDIKIKNTKNEYIAHASTWLNGERWLDFEEIEQNKMTAENLIKEMGFKNEM